MSGGMNPRWGRDAGSRPPFGPYGHPMMAPGHAYLPQASFRPANPYGFTPFQPGYQQYAHPGFHCASGMPHVPYHAVPHPMGAYPGGGHFPPQPNGTGVIGWNPRMANPSPLIDTSMPAAQMTNSTGGTGCEPGYNYFFPAEHCKVHVFTSATPPWQNPPGAAVQFKASHVPTNTTVGDLLKGFGCTNPNPKRNRCYEIVQAGNGNWYKGLCITGDHKEMIKKSIKELGWDATRTGLPGGKPVVCLWFVKD